MIECCVQTDFSKDMSKMSVAKPPVLFLTFNRPESTAAVFDAIRRFGPDKLYLAADGGRSGIRGEPEACEAVRKIITAVDWPCEVKTLFRDENLGCKLAVSGAIDWFFRHEEEGVILEDDCLPSEEFFDFCAQMLLRYRENDAIWMVTGNNLQAGRARGTASYYFSKYTHIWGWATWRRAWANYSVDMDFWPEMRLRDQWKNLFDLPPERYHWQRIFDRSYQGKIDTWDYAWMATVWLNDGLTVTPNANLVRNIGLGCDATHTTGASKKFDIPLEPLGEIVFCDQVMRDIEADQFVYNTIFRESLLSILWRAPKIFRKYLLR